MRRNMHKHRINRISSQRGATKQKNIVFAFAASLYFLFMLLAFVSPVKAGPVGGNPIGGSAGGGSMSSQAFGINNSNVGQMRQNYFQEKPTYAKEANIMQQPMSDPSGGSSSDGPSRALQASQPPPVTKQLNTTVEPPIPQWQYQQPPNVATMTGTDSSLTTQQSEQPLTDNGLAMTAAQDLAVKAINAKRELDAEFDPGRLIPAAQATAQTLGTSFANSVASAAQGPPGTGGTGGSVAAAFTEIAGVGGAGGAGGFSGNDGGELDSFMGAMSGMPSPGLINVANEAAGTPTVSFTPFKTISQAVWMVQQMYKHFSIPLAVLLLLPGAVITQVKAQITANFNLKGEDATSPFEGILRAMVAIFLIPATQLIVSYSIDVGNSLAYSVNPAVGIMPILGWLQQVAYSTMPSNNDNAILPPEEGGLQQEQGSGSDGGGPFSMMQGGGGLGGILGGGFGGLGGGGMGGGLAAGESDDQSAPEGQSNLSTTLETMFNVMMYMFSIGLLVMTAFQLAIMCYLYLLGPVAAAFFAWPSVKGKIFRPIFGNWVNAVITVSLWRFYWMVILAIMTNRLLNLGENGSMLFNLQWEVAIFTCLIGLLFYVPMNPWNFDPGQAYRSAQFFGEQIMQSAAAGAKGGGGGEGGQQKGGGGEGGQQKGGDNSSGQNKSGGNNGANTENARSFTTASAGSTINDGNGKGGGTEADKGSSRQIADTPSPSSASGNNIASNSGLTSNGPPIADQAKDQTRDVASLGSQSGANQSASANQPASNNQPVQPNLTDNAQSPPPSDLAGIYAASMGSFASGGQGNLTAMQSPNAGQGFDSASQTGSAASTSAGGSDRAPVSLLPDSNQGAPGESPASMVQVNDKAPQESIDQGMKDYQGILTASNQQNLPPASQTGTGNQTSNKPANNDKDNLT